MSCIHRALDTHFESQFSLSASREHCSIETSHQILPCAHTNMCHTFNTALLEPSLLPHTLVNGSSCKERGDLSSFQVLLLAQYCLVISDPDQASHSACPPYLNGLGYVHFVYFNLGKAAPLHIFIFFIITIKEVRSIYSNTDGSLWMK